MNNDLKECLLLMLSDGSDTSASSDESDSENLLLLNLVTECVAAEERINIKSATEKRIERFTDKQFIKHLCIRREVAASLSEKFNETPYYQNIKKHGKPSLSAKNHIFVFLWFLGHSNGSYKEVSKHFGISMSTLHFTLHRVGLFLTDMASEVIKWPDENKRKQSAQIYLERTGISGIIGCIDSTFFLADQSKNCLKKYGYKIPVQAVCNEENRFIDLYISEVCSEQNANLFNESCLEEKLTKLEEEYHLAGDTNYPCLKNLMTPFRDEQELDDIKIFYNQSLSTCVCQIEYCLSSLKERFRQLNYLNVRSAKLQYLLIKSCFVLHNLNNEFEDFLRPDCTGRPPKVDYRNNALETGAIKRAELISDINIFMFE